MLEQDANKYSKPAEAIFHKQEKWGFKNFSDELDLAFYWFISWSIFQNLVVNFISKPEFVGKSVATMLNVTCSTDSNWLQILPNTFFSSLRVSLYDENRPPHSKF